MEADRGRCHTQDLYMYSHGAFKSLNRSNLGRTPHSPFNISSEILGELELVGHFPSVPEFGIILGVSWPASPVYFRPARSEGHPVNPS